MSFDVKAKVEELVGKVQKDPATLKDFQDDPIKTVEKLLGVDLPDEQLQPLVAGIKAKLAAAATVRAAALAEEPRKKGLFFWLKGR